MATTTIRLLVDAPDAPVLELSTRPDAGTFRFDGATYDEVTDRLRLTAGPPQASWTERSPEGHVLRVGVADGRLAEVHLVEVRRRLVEDGRLEVTVSPGQRAVLGVEDIAHLLTRRAREGRGRFARSV